MKIKGWGESEPMASDGMGPEKQEGKHIALLNATAPRLADKHLHVFLKRKALQARQCHQSHSIPCYRKNQNATKGIEFYELHSKTHNYSYKEAVFYVLGFFCISQR